MMMVVVVVEGLRVERLRALSADDDRRFNTIILICRFVKLIKISLSLSK